ncbi:MAG TPA: response regulator transcription factor [Gemmatimonadales bacterium]|nr:response regulator transcription factor [Gemmatimonadales bacterium]
MKPVRILLVDDHGLFRAGLRALLRSASGFAVVAEAADGHEALRLAARRRPDVVLMDIAMPGLNGLEAAGRLSEQFPTMGIVVLSMHAEPEYVRLALRAGARGYLLKHAARPELELAIRTVARGDTYLSRAVANLVTQNGSAPEDEQNGAARLTSRQREILQLIAEGLTSKQIAQRLTVSIKTIEAHRGRLMARLGIHDIAGLVRWAIRNHVVVLDSVTPHETGENT